MSSRLRHLGSRTGQEPPKKELLEWLSSVATSASTTPARNPRTPVARAPGLRCRGHRHAGTGSAAAEPTPLLDAQRLGSSSSRSSLVSDSARTYVLVNYERMTQSSDALLSHLRGDSHTAVDGNIEHLVRDGLRQDVSHV